MPSRSRSAAGTWRGSARRMEQCRTALGLEARLMGQVGHAVTRQGLTLAEANQLVLRLLDKYEHVFQLPGGNPGARFDRSYDLKTLHSCAGMVRHVRGGGEGVAPDGAGYSVILTLQGTSPCRMVLSFLSTNKRKEDKSMALYLVVNLAIVIALGFIARLLWKK